MLMLRKINLLLLALGSFLSTVSGLTQTNEIKIKFIGNCGLHLTDGTLNIYVDFPYKSGFYNYMEYDSDELDSIRENSIFLFTHKHPDHYSVKNMRKTLRKKKGHKYGKWNLKKLQMLSDTTADFTIQAFETEHSLSCKHQSYLITWHGKRFYFSGDEESPDFALTMTDLDWAFVPYWLVTQLNERKQELNTKMLGVYHFYPIMQTSNSRPDRIKLFVTQGEVVTVPYD